MRPILFFLILILYQQPLWADPVLYGPEWTFTNQRLINQERLLPPRGGNPLQRSLEFLKGFDPHRELFQWVDAIRETCPDCKVEPLNRGHSTDYEYEVRTADGFWFRITQDSWVREVVAKPMSLEEIKSRQQQIQRLVWDTAFEAGLSPHWRVGGGHIHIDYQAKFASNPQLLRNFIVDVMNHPELFMGALSLDYLNAPALAMWGKESTANFKVLLDAFDSTDITGRTLMDAINRRVYRRAHSKQIPMAESSTAKYHALAFGELHLEKTLELRGLRPQESAEHYLKMVELIDARVRMLEKLDRPLEYIEKDYSDKISYRMDHKMELYETQVDPEHILRIYKSYVEGAGLDPSEYLPLITKELKERLPQPLSRYTNLRCSQIAM